MSRQEMLRDHRVYFVINRTAGITQEYLNTAREKYLRGELIEGIDYIERK